MVYICREAAWLGVWTSPPNAQCASSGFSVFQVSRACDGECLRAWGAKVCLDAQLVLYWSNTRSSAVQIGELVNYYFHYYGSRINTSHTSPIYIYTFIRRCSPASEWVSNIHTKRCLSKRSFINIAPVHFDSVCAADDEHRDWLILSYEIKWWTTCIVRDTNTHTHTAPITHTTSFHNSPLKRSSPNEPENEISNTSEPHIHYHRPLFEMPHPNLLSGAAAHNEQSERNFKKNLEDV